MTTTRGDVDVIIIEHGFAPLAEKRPPERVGAIIASTGPSRTQIARE
jgi:acyl-CoA hydrolase